jgi:drug/metabolite transporter (DMT)-like permease
VNASVSGRQIAVVLVCVLMGAVGGVLLKAGSVRLEHDGGGLETLRQAATQPFLISGLVLYAVPLAAYVVLLKSMPLSVLQPLLALTYVITPVLGRFVNDEVVPPTRWVGIGIIVAGVVVVARS